MLTNDPTVIAYQSRRHTMRALVDMYDSIQNLRKGADNKRRSHEQGYDEAAVADLTSDVADLTVTAELPFLTGVRDNLRGIEDGIAKYLENQAKQELLGQWLLSIDGIGGVLAAGLLAFIDFHRCCCGPYRHLKGKERVNIPVHDCPGLATAGAIHSFAGLLDKEKQPWLPGQRRPYNVRLKTHCWKIADQFRRQTVNVKKLVMDEEQMIAELRQEDKYKGLDSDELLLIVQGKKARMEKKLAKMDTRLYAQLYRQRKDRDTQYNEEGRFRERALAILANAKKRKVSVSPEQKKCWEAGKLQPCGIDLRAMRYAVKIFLSHFHQIGREIYFKDKVKPWVIVHGGHTHYIPAPNWPMPVKKARSRSA